MNWYLAKIVFRIFSGDERSSQFDEQLRLVQASDYPSAFGKAVMMGETEEVVFLNERQQRVEWKFVNVSELRMLDSLSDGTELYSRIEERENGDQYEMIIQQKAKDLIQASGALRSRA